MISPAVREIRTPITPEDVNDGEEEKNFDEKSVPPSNRPELYPDIFPIEFDSHVCEQSTPGIVLNSPFIVKFYDAFVEAELASLSLVIEYMNGGGLNEKILAGQLLDEDDVTVVLYSVLSALKLLHDMNILHRDIKPSNILTDSNGNIKLTDFGITKVMDTSQHATTFTGTLAFMSPEVTVMESYLTLI